jgi:hypothetical protein
MMIPNESAVLRHLITKLLNCMLIILLLSEFRGYLKIRGKKDIPITHNIRGGKDLRKIVFALLALLALIGMATAEQIDENLRYNNPTSIEEKNLIFNLDQKVSGTGFFATYKYSLMPDVLGTEGRLFNGVEAKCKVHGSGKIDSDSMMYAESSYTNTTWVNGALDEDGEIIQNKEETTSIVQMKIDGTMSYSPTAMGKVSRYYALHPVFFDSLLDEEDWIKNRDGLNSLYHRVDKAHGLKIALDAQSDTTNNTMDVEEDLINGRVHFGALQLEGIPVDEVPEDSDSEGESPVLGFAMKAWKNPSIELDEDYVGTFHIKKNMNLYTSSEDTQKEEGWLPCCFGGWDTMRYYDRGSFGKSTKGVFDCTCLKVPSQAQNPK